MTSSTGRLSWRPALTVSMAIGLAIAIVAAAFALAAYNEHLGQQERFRQAEVQLRILAGSMAAPLAFDDRSAAREYVGAQSSNPDVEAVAAYDMQGQLAASYVRAGARAAAGAQCPGAAAQRWRAADSDLAGHRG
ncbi:CHASE sensor domain-containing protein [Caulobacter sp. UC70_42]|uniref:CHASE sensor domain-containing protein n=1 Tax=Caulobacter sp. UC70_42 TaxID=3374551 RepID=UPI003757CA78